jgi:hypothetical protein
MAGFAIAIEELLSVHRKIGTVADQFTENGALVED